MSVQAISWAMTQQTGDPRAKVVLICLANYADELGRCWPSQATLAEQSEQSVDTVRDRLNDMEESGLIRREKRLRPDGGKTSDLFILQIVSARTHAATGGVPHPATGGVPILLPAGTHTGSLAGSHPATEQYHRTVTDTKGEEERENLVAGKREERKEGNPGAVWIDGDHPSWPSLADRRERETGKRPHPTGSKYETGLGYYFPADWPELSTVAN